MSSDNASSSVTYTSISSDSNGLSWGIPLVNASELPEMDPYEEEDTNEDSIDYLDEPEDGDKDPEEDPSEEHKPEDDDLKEDPSEEHEPEDEDTKEEEPSEGSYETELFEEDEIAVTPPPPRHRRARISVRP
ncbi:hypothetical protein Tco_1199719 [Tanacetum coccineum]